MSASSSNSVATDCGGRLPRRDWILVPATGLLTIVLMAVSTEVIARMLFPVSQAGLENCFVANDLSGTAPAKPNSVCSERVAESRFPVVYKFNNRGDREDSDLEAKQPGAYRIVMIGSSFAMGSFIPREMSFAATLPEQLSQQTGRKVELYNEAVGGKFRGGPFPIKDSILRFREVLSAAPDVILWVITPMDIENSGLDSSEQKQQVSAIDAPKQNPKPGGFIDIWTKLRNSIAQGSFGDKLRARWEQSRTALLIKYFLIASESPNQYAESYLKNKDDAEFLKAEPSAEWQHSFRDFESEAEEFERQASGAGVPFMAVLVPNRAQSAMIAANSWPPGYDPYRLDSELRALIDSHGGTFIDILPYFRDVPGPEQYYFPVDGHLDSKGHAMISWMLAKELTNGGVAALRATTNSQHLWPKGNRWIPLPFNLFSSG